jgi:hypothetical protein
MCARVRPSIETRRIEESIAHRDHPEDGQPMSPVAS